MRSGAAGAAGAGSAMATGGGAAEMPAAWLDAAACFATADEAAADEAAADAAAAPTSEAKVCKYPRLLLTSKVLGKAIGSMAMTVLQKKYATQKQKSPVKPGVACDLWEN